MKATGESGQCGANAMPLASAIAAMSSAFRMPPTWTRSGWSMCTPFAAMTSENSAGTYILSPVAIGMWVMPAISGSQRL